jgi:hypothetical protein
LQDCSRKDRKRRTVTRKLRRKIPNCMTHVGRSIRMIKVAARLGRIKN